MAYEGERLIYCPINLNLSNIQVVIVSGTGPNKFGHALLYVPIQSLYFQIAGVHTYPMKMNSEGFNRYLIENGKSELGRRNISVPKPDLAYNALMLSTSKKWIWGGVINNCITFIQEIITAGGSNVKLNNLPTQNL